MSASTIIFYIIAAMILATGIVAVTSRKIFRAAIALLFSLVGIAGLYFWMNVNFIAAVQIIVYVGGIVVLIIFSIFLTQKSGEEMPKALTARKIFSILAALLGFAFTFRLISLNSFKPVNGANAFEVDVAQVGTQMLSTTEHGFVLPFEAISMLLLAAMIGCIVIAIKSKPETK